MQRWRFLVIRDAKVKETVGALYKRAWDEQVAPRYRSGEPAPGTSREQFERMLAAGNISPTTSTKPPCGSFLASKALHRPEPPGRRSTQPFRTCYWRHERSASARL